MVKSKKRFHPLKWIIWFLAVLFYFFEYILRVFPSITVDQLMESFTITAGSLGILSAFYLYAYAPMQLPVGILMDRYGARRLLTFGAMICAIGSILFAFSYHIGLADISRLLMGAGSAFGFIGMIYISSHWFSGKTLALLIGLGNSLGMLGAVVGQGPLSYLTQPFGWREVSFALGIFGALLALAIFLVVRNEPKGISTKKTPNLNILKNIFLVCKNGQTWINIIISFSFYLTTAAFAALWAVPFLERVHQFSVHMAGFAASMIFMGWIIGGPIIGHLSDKAGNRKYFLLICTALTFFALLPLIYMDGLSHSMIFILLFLIGVFSSAQLLNFSLAIELNNEKAKGMAVALTNFSIFVAGSIIQWLVGYLIEFHRQGFVVDDLAVYTPENFRFALSCFPISCLVAFIFTLILKESKHHTHTSPH